MVANPRARVFVHLPRHRPRRTSTARGGFARRSSRRSTRLIGPDDLVAVMTPGHVAAPTSPSRARRRRSKVFWRGTGTGASATQSHSIRSAGATVSRVLSRLPPPLDCPDGRSYDDRGVADEMIARRREKMTIDALSNLVTYLRGVREERKAVLAITDGWLLFKPNPSLARKLNCQVPGLPQAGFDPRTGSLSAGGQPDPITGSEPAVVRPRPLDAFAHLDDDQEFRTLARRRPTAPIRRSIRSIRAASPSSTRRSRCRPPACRRPVRRRSRRRASIRDCSAIRLDSLRTLAEATDGLAIVNSQRPRSGVQAHRRRSVVLLPARLLLDRQAGWKIPFDHGPGETARRARARAARLSRGDAAAAADVVRAEPPCGRIGRDAGGAAAAAATHAVEAAIAPLSGYAREVPLRLQLAAGWKPGDSASAAMWVVGELGGAAVAGSEWTEGFEVDGDADDCVGCDGRHGRVTACRAERPHLQASR